MILVILIRLPGSILIKITFMYTGSDYYSGREVVVQKLTEAVASVIPLPTEIQIRFANLGQSLYGTTSLEYCFRNRISINTGLSIAEIPLVLVHELIHLSQSHTGILKVNRQGHYFWHGIQYDQTGIDYAKLPWEVDVYARLESVTTDALKYALSKG